MKLPENITWGLKLLWRNYMPISCRWPSLLWRNNIHFKKMPDQCQGHSWISPSGFCWLFQIFLAVVCPCFLNGLTMPTTIHTRQSSFIIPPCGFNSLSWSAISWSRINFSFKPQCCRDIANIFGMKLNVSNIIILKLAK